MGEKGKMSGMGKHARESRRVQIENKKRLWA
jgi:hypothetical protein